MNRREFLGTAAAGASFAPVASPAAGAPPATRVSLIPLLWTQGQDEATIRKVIREVAAGGNTGFTWESRPHPDYLGPAWWRDLGVAIDEAATLGLDVWVFDEWMYPSGVAGGRVVEANREFALHTITERSIALDGPASEKTYEPPTPLSADERLISVVAIPASAKSEAEPIDLTSRATAGRIAWAAPEGRWELVWTVARIYAPTEGWKMSNMIDVMNPAATAAFIRITHDATWQHFRQHFGKTIKGFFSDETGFRNITSYASLPGTPGMPMPWSPALPRFFRRLKGYDLGPSLPALWHDLGPRSRTVRYDFVDVCSRAFAEHFFHPQQEWCRAHGVRLIGHVVEDNHADHNLGYGPGHWFRAMRYFDMPGIDVVGFQVTQGVDASGVRWTVNHKEQWDQEHFQFGLPAMARGAALLQGTREILSEAFGAYGWNAGMRAVKQLGDWHIVNGINVVSLHACTMKCNDPDCPPHFNRASGNPQWRHYRAWAEPFAAQQRLLADTEPLYDAAVLYTAESKWVGPAYTVGPTVRVLETAQISTVVLPYEALEAKLEIRDGAWLVRGARLRSVVLPYARFVPAYAIEQLAALAHAGVKVIAVDGWPEASVDARADDAVRAAVARLKRPASAAVALMAELPLRIATPRLSLEGANSSLATALRRDAAGDWLILH